MSFARLNLNENIYKALTACGYTHPTPIQEQAIPSILANKDVVACAQTGTGKTAAFVLPALNLLSQKLQPSKKAHILILTPTRELATQITTAVRKYGKFLRFNTVSLMGGMSYHHQLQDLTRGADLIVATPGRLIDHIENKRVDLSKIEMLVLDEADRMLDMGFINDVQYIANLTPANRQTLLFSATVDQTLATVIRQLLKNPIRIDLSHTKESAPQITQEMYKVSGSSHKARLLNHFLNNGNMYKAIIFSATKMNADRIAGQLCHDGFRAAALHGDLRQNIRNRTIEQLRLGKIQYLVATDVAARGIDINDVTHVINYDLPRFSEDYVHRIGRTGRAGKTGTAISFVSPTDTKHLQNIERFTGNRMKLIYTDEVTSAVREQDHRDNHRDAHRDPERKPRFKKSFSPSRAQDRRKSPNKEGAFRSNKKTESRSGFRMRKQSVSKKIGSR